MLCLKYILLILCLDKTIEYHITLVCSHYSQQGGDLEEALQQLSSLDAAKKQPSANKDSTTENKVKEYYQVQQSLRDMRDAAAGDGGNRDAESSLGSSIASWGDNAQTIDKIRSVAAMLCQQVFIAF